MYLVTFPFVFSRLKTLQIHTLFFHRSYSQVQSEATTRKQVMTNTSKTQVKKFSYLNNENKAEVTSNTPWKAALDKNVPGAQTNAEDFTKQFMQTYEPSQSQMEVKTQMEATKKEENVIDEHYEEMMQYAQAHEEQRQLIDSTHQLPPQLPPKTKIMFSPSRHLFSPSESVDDSDTTSVNTVEYVPVKEKVKMIAQQQEEIVRREEMRKKTGGDVPTGGVRILPPSPVTVRKTESHEMHQQQQHRVHFQTDEVEHKQLSRNQVGSQQKQLTRQQAEDQQKSAEFQRSAEMTQAAQQLTRQLPSGHQAAVALQSKQQASAEMSAVSQLQNIEKSESRSSQISAASADEIMYEATAQVTSSTANTAQIVTTTQQPQNRIIPRLEDKYEINAALDELVAHETHSESSYTSSVQQASLSSRSTQQSAYSSMTASSSTTMKQSETSSVKTLKDSSYSTASSTTSTVQRVESSSASMARSGIEIEVSTQKVKTKAS